MSCVTILLYGITMSNNASYKLFIISYLLLRAGIETNPGPPNVYPKSIRIVHNNVCSLYPKIDSINAELSDNDIIGISETHLDDTISNEAIQMAGFHSPVRKDRNRHGGGVALYISNKLAYQVRDDLFSNDLEIVWSEIHTNCKKFLVGVLYRPPSSLVQYWEFFISNVEKAMECDLPIFLLGDFNTNILSEQSLNFKLMLQRLNLQNYINDPTNFSNFPVNSGTCIDLILTNNTNMVMDTFILPPFCSSHSVIGIEIQYKTFKEYAYKREIMDFKAADYAGLRTTLLNIDWDDVFNDDDDDIDHIYAKFLLTTKSCINKHIPTKIITVRPKDKIFMNNTIRHFMRKRNRIHHKAVRSKNPLHWEKYRFLRNKVIDEIRLSRDNYNKKLTEQINKSIPPGKWWRIVKSLSKLRNDHKPVPPIKSSGKTLFHPIEKANAFNTFFSNISTMDHEPNLPLHGPGPPTNFQLENFVISDQEVLDQLLILNTNKPPGPDGISPLILKNIASSLYKPLTKLFNMSLSIGKLPLIWKSANISPIYKNKGSAQEINNYRPISVTSILCKVLERIIVKHLYNYVLDHDIINKYQSGFQPNDSTTNQLIEIYNTIISSMDKGNDVRFIFCDISKAFDRVWHNGILYKLRNYGMSDQIIKWIENYLTNRSQRVVLDGFSSSPRSTNSGVPQGSVLGPFLFLLYINDISKNLQNSVRLFADDTSLFDVVDKDMISSAESLTNDLEVIHQWSKQWAMDFNPDKTTNLDFTRKQTTHPRVRFGINGPMINRVSNHTHLGICFQSDGCWKTHILNIHEKASSRLNILRMLKYSLNRKSLIKIYFSFIRPVLEYANLVWDNCTLRESNLLEDVQVSAARIITGLRINSSRTALYQELGWDTLACRRKIHKLTLFYKMVHGIAPKYLQDLLLPCTPSQHSYTLRNDDNFKFILPQVKTTSYMNSFLPSTIRLWNDLPLYVRNNPSLSSFRNALKKLFCLQTNKLFDIGKRKSNIVHCQLRNNASNLNAHLKSHFLRDNATCDSCGHHTENSFHFFFQCPEFADHRTNLISGISEMQLSVPVSLNLLLHGEKCLSFNDNKKIFELVQNYILETKRF